MIKKAKKPIKKSAVNLPKEMSESNSEPIRKTKIRIIGIGGGAGTIVSEIAAKLAKATFVAANTDTKALKTIRPKVIRFPFGQNLTRGLGTGMDAVLGENAALAETEKIKKLLIGQDFCILVTCLGGGTGSGALPVFAKISRKLGNITYGIFTLPFQFEGDKKMEIAKESLKKVKNYLNAFSVIPNERVFQIINKETPLKQALSTVNKTLCQSLQGLIETIYEPGLINIDFADFRTISEGHGRLAYLNTVEIQRKKGQVQDLIKTVLNSPLYPYTIRGAKGVLFNIAGEKDLSLAEVSQISKNISELVNPDARIIFGVAQGQRYSDIIKITLLANGCSTKLFSNSPADKKNIRNRVPITQSGRRSKRSKASLSHKTKKPGIKQIKNKIVKPKKPSASKTKKKTRKPKKPTGGQKIISELKTEEKENPVQNVAFEETIRKNALQVRKEAEELEKEMLAKEQIWETPSFLRKNLFKE